MMNRKKVFAALSIFFDSLESAIVSWAMLSLLTTAGVAALLVGAELGRSNASTQEVLDRGLPIVLGVYLGTGLLWVMYRIIKWVMTKAFDKADETKTTPTGQVTVDS